MTNYRKTVDDDYSAARLLCPMNLCVPERLMSVSLSIFRVVAFSFSDCVVVIYIAVKTHMP